MNTVLTGTGLPTSRHQTVRPFRLQPPIAALIPGQVSEPGLPRGMAFAIRTPRGATASLGLRTVPSRLTTAKAESSSLSYGLVVHLPLLSTPSLDDAVTFGYKVLTNFDGDFHPADLVRL
jgi:hypothetical protein